MKEEKKEVLIERVLTVWGVVVILWSFFRSNVAGPLWLSEFIAKPAIFLLPILVFVTRFQGGKSIAGALGLQATHTFREIMLALGIFLALMVIGAYTLMGGAALSLLGSANWSRIALFTSIALATAVVEEIMGRGFLFRYLLQYSRSMLLSAVLSSILFFILYLPGILTTSISGDVLLMSLMLNLTISLVTIMLYSLRGSLYIPIAVHMAILLWFDILWTSAVH